MAMLNLDHENVTVIQATADGVRGWFDGIGSFQEELEGALDEAQESVKSGKDKVRYVVVRIT